LFEMLFGRDELVDSGEAADAIEAFVVDCLTAEGTWSGRESDGIATLRVVERTATRASIAGRIWLVASQIQEPFWIVAERDRSGDVRWSLHYGLPVDTTRRARDAVLVADSPDAITWRASLLGSSDS
jgi:hypothetical protein